MGLFNNYENSGKGVSKNGPRKKPFFRFVEIFGRKFWTFFILNFIYLLLCVPLVTFGPATAALTHVMRKFYLEDSIFVYSEFWSAFKKNFKQSLAIGIVDVLMLALGVYTVWFYLQQASTMDSTQNFILLATSVAALVYVLMMHFYIYEQIVSLNLSLGKIIKNSLLLAVAGLKSNIIALLTVVFFMTIIVLLFPYSTLVLPFIPFAWLNFTIVFCTYPVIQKTIINPFYEARGEVNPELKGIVADTKTDDVVFEDKGGEESEIRVEGKKRRALKVQSDKDGGGSSQVAKHGKVIR